MPTMVIATEGLIVSVLIRKVPRVGFRREPSATGHYLLGDTCAPAAITCWATPVRLRSN